MIDPHTAFGHHLLEIAIAYAVAAIPAHRPEHDLAPEVAPLEVRHGPALLARAFHRGTPRALQQSPMESFLAAIAGRRGDDATAKAQDVMYEAWERTTSRSRTALARKALGISPLCADAYVLLAEEARSIEEARDLYAKGVEAGELALGPRGFKEYAGHFWGFLETRP